MSPQRCRRGRPVVRGILRRRDDDLYIAKCPEKSYEVHIDMYMGGRTDQFYDAAAACLRRS